MRLQDRLPDAGALTISQVLLGTRPVPADGLPVLGYAPGHANLYLAVTHSGVTLAPLIADLCVMETLDASNSPLLNSFRPARFQ
jgi:glycine/D-amino acid oxidase-like deaminating enzyme